MPIISNFPSGTAATINGVNTLTLKATGKIKLNQDGSTCTLDGADLVQYVDDLKNDANNHITNADIHVTVDEKAAWDGKSDSGHDHDGIYLKLNDDDGTGQIISCGGIYVVSFNNDMSTFNGNVTFCGSTHFDHDISFGAVCTATNLRDPTEPQEAATKNYVDIAVQTAIGDAIGGAY